MFPAPSPLNSLSTSPALSLLQVHLYSMHSILYLSLSVTPVDYGEILDAPLEFPPCERRSCVDIPIVDDDVLENSELFNVTLERNGLDSVITLDPVDGLVEITDNDGTHTVIVA